MKHLYLALLVLAMSGCGIFKKVEKHKTLDKISTSVVAKSDSTSLVVDKTKTTITEKADTTVSTPTKVITQETVFNMDSLVNGMTAVQNELIDIRFTLDPKTGVLLTEATLKPQKVQFQFDKTTTMEKDITSKAEVKKENQTSQDELHKSNNVVKEPKNTGLYVVLILGIVAIIAYLLYRRFGGK